MFLLAMLVLLLLLILLLTLLLIFLDVGTILEVGAIRNEVLGLFAHIAYPCGVSST